MAIKTRGPWDKLPAREGVRRRDGGVRYGTEHIDEGIRIMNQLRHHALKQGLMPAQATIPAQIGVLPEPVPTHDGYCLGCKAKVLGVPTKGEKSTKNGTRHLYGDCPTCGTGVHTFAKKEAASGTG